MKNYELYEKCLTGLIKDAVLQENGTEISDEIDLDVLCDIIKWHKLSSLLYPVLEVRGIKNAELAKEFGLWLTTETKQQYYLEKIKERLTREKIRFLCIKGAYLRTLYPEPYMRYSNDLDIFVDDENTEKVRDIMLELGFTIHRFNRLLQDDAYNLGRFVHIEIHRKLISNKCPWDEKCQEIINRIEPKEDGAYEYVMSEEDCYLYLIAHMAKHFKYSGCGIRMVLDIWVYLRKFGEKMDRKLLNERLEYCGLDLFAKAVEKLVGYWFCGEEADKKTKIFGEYIFESGLFGNDMQFFATEMGQNLGNVDNKNAGVIKKMAKLMFLPYKDMCISYPSLVKYPVLLPFYWVFRAFNVFFFKRGKIMEEMASYDGIDVDYAKKVAEFKKSMGL
ncbi:MAG: nucleotidyltransferase family protein [Clostridia bacterium]|nr:nucleotidyltransferase family protein [Clostridia bacterium]